MPKLSIYLLNNNLGVTTRYKYGNDDSEYIFTCKGRPFAVLASAHLPTPTSPLLDYDLVRSLGLKMTDLQCRKFAYAGNRLRILGRVSTAVQCLDQGRVSGNYHIKALVVSDLNTVLDTHCVASAKMKQQMTSREVITIAEDDEGNSCTYSGALATPSRSQAAPAPRLLSAASSPRSVPAASPPRSPSTPPGFPKTPQYGASAGASAAAASSAAAPATPHSAPNIPVVRWLSSDGQMVSPLSANISALSAVFKDADLEAPDDCQETFALEKADPDGDLESDDDGNLNFNMCNGVYYQFGHGRTLCSHGKCSNRDKLKVSKYPNNCGFNPQWMLPNDYIPCGPKCKGGFCSCLSKYRGMADHGYNQKRGRGRNKEERKEK